ncbi:MAG: hypothetical protein PHU44_02470 [Syntrophales bacterium]|nr:hypothetical protein [Syntrophales bacterium]MDD5641219.1 hypothetical protein [Syntrophales bacterium]
MIQALSSIFKKSLGLVLLTFFLSPAAAFSQTSPPDVGLVTRLEGKATYRNNQEKQTAPVKAFMKVRQGDNIKLAQDSSLTLLYFTGGRQETWKGPAAFLAGASASKATGNKKAATPEIKMMPSSAIKKIAAAPFLLARAGAGPAGATQMPRVAPGRAGGAAMKSMEPPGRSGATPMMEQASPGRSGAIQTMAPVCKLPPPGPSPEEAQKIIKEGQAVYQDLKKQAGPDDFTPELYFLGVLAECRRYSEMNKMLDEMLQKKPGDAALQKMKSWVRTQTLCGG